MIYIGLTVGSVLFLILYIIVSFIIYRNNELEKFNIKNCFSYELFLNKKRKQFSFNILILISMMFVFVNAIIYTVKPFDTLKLISCLFMIIAICLFVAISIIPLSKYKEHCACSILFILCIGIYGGINFFNNLRLYNIEHNIYEILAFSVDAIVLLSSLIVILNPKLITFKMDKDEDGKLIRPKIIPMAFSEWIMLFVLLFSQLSIVFISLI